MINVFSYIVFFCVTAISMRQSYGFNRKDSSSSRYLIYKIDSVHSYFLIYAKRADSLFKIVSKKELPANCEEIKVGEEYDLDLHSLWNTDIWIGDVNVKPSLIPHVTCFGFDATTSICIDREHGIYDLFVTPDLKGLCVFKSP
jgi:hypothetical protein